MSATALLVVLLFSGAAEESAKGHYEREAHFDAVWTNYGKFFDVVHKARDFAFRANGGEGNLEEFGNTDTIRLSDGVQSATVDFAPNFCPADLDGRNLPPRSVTANYRLLRPKRSPISELEITLGGWGGNFIKVAGSDQTQVDAASALLLNELVPVSTRLGSLGFKILVHAVLVIIALVFWFGPMALEVSHVRGIILPWLGSIAIVGLMLSGIVARSLPICSISDSPGWLDKYSALFTFLSLAVSIAAPILAALWDMSRHRSSGPAPAKRSKHPKRARKDE